MSDKKQTAVELVFDCISEILGDDIVNSFSVKQTNAMNYLSKQALQMEREQIEDAWKSDRHFIFYDAETDELSEHTINELSQQYYNETYGK